MSRKYAESSALLTAVEQYLSKYVTFSSPDYVFAASLWAAATYLWPHFDAFPYLVITSDTKRSGKSRFAEVLSFVSSNPKNFAGMTAATLFRSIRDDNPTVFIDEAETLSSEEAGVMRAVLNVGYRRGQTIPRMAASGVVEWPAYCPKVFVLIGDVYDTLRDRSIVMRMRRGEPGHRFVYDAAKNDGAALGARMHELLTDRKDEVVKAYQSHPGLSYLPDRDEEIWLTLFAVCGALAPERVTELERVAVDMATEKTVEKRRYVDLAGAEQEAEADEYARRLLRDLLTVLSGERVIFTADALQRLYELPTGPWRKFRGAGLTPIDMGNLLSRFGLSPKVIRVGSSKKKSDTKVARGYRREDVQAAAGALR